MRIEAQHIARLATLCLAGCCLGSIDQEADAGSAKVVDAGLDAGQVSCPTIEYFGLPSSTLGHPYLSQFVAEGCVPPYLWSTDGGLPEGLSLNPDGLLSGTPTAYPTPNPARFSVQASDGQGNESEAQFTLAVLPAGDLTVQHDGG